MHCRYVAVFEHQLRTCGFRSWLVLFLVVSSEGSINKSLWCILSVRCAQVIPALEPSSHLAAELSRHQRLSALLMHVQSLSEEGSAHEVRVHQAK